MAAALLGPFPPRYIAHIVRQVVLIIFFVSKRYSKLRLSSLGVTPLSVIFASPLLSPPLVPPHVRLAIFAVYSFFLMPFLFLKICPRERCSASPPFSVVESSFFRPSMLFWRASLFCSDTVVTLCVLSLLIFPNLLNPLSTAVHLNKITKICKPF